MQDTIIEIFKTFALAIVTGIASWFFTKRKYNAEVKGAEVQNFDAAIDAYKKMYEDMISDLKTQNGELKEEVSELKAELSENRKQIMILTNFVLTSTLKSSDDGLDQEAINKLKSIL